MLKACSVLFAITAVLFAIAQTARADGIVVTADKVVANLTEGQSLLVNYTAVITVTTTGGVLIQSATDSPRMAPSGDITDLLKLDSLDPFTLHCAATFYVGGNGGAANTCQFQLTYSPVQDVAVENSDSGSATAELILGLSDANFKPLGISGTADTQYTVNDPAAVPEPSSLLLLGTGLLGVVGAARRKWLGHGCGKLGSIHRGLPQQSAASCS